MIGGRQHDLAILAEAVLWDDDWLDDETQDMPPDQAVAFKRRLDIPADYYVSPAPDPKPGELRGLIERMEGLLSGISERRYVPGRLPDRLQRYLRRHS